MTTPARTHTVLVYSDDPKVREAVRLAVGRRPADDLGLVDYVECATEAALLKAVDAGGIDVAVMDGEARPAGGLGLAKQLKDELQDCPPTLVLVARKDDAWIAKWSLADAVQPLPIEPFALTAAVAGLLRHREAALPVRRAAAV
ncbi:MAG: response regulator receiver protein [Frankiales bacterium]|nr:response regulator receiver protein [Frankiales bacterium]